MARVKKAGACLLALVMMLTAVGCSHVNKAESAVKHTLNAMRAGNLAEAAEYVSGADTYDKDWKDGYNDENMELFRELLRRMEYKIVFSEKIDENTVHVTTDITAVDMGILIKKLVAHSMSAAFDQLLSNGDIEGDTIKETIKDMYMAELSKPDVATTKKRIVLKVVKEDDQWKVVMDDVLVKFVFGGWGQLIDRLDSIARS